MRGAGVHRERLDAEFVSQLLLHHAIDLPGLNYRREYALRNAHRFDKPEIPAPCLLVDKL